MRISPNPPWILYHSGVVRVKEKLARGLRKFCEVLRCPATIFALLRRFATKWRHFASRPPEFVADVFHVWLKIIIDLHLFAMYNIVMKLRNRYEYYRSEWHKHWRVVIWHPLTFLLVMIAIGYAFEL